MASGSHQVVRLLTWLIAVKDLCSSNNVIVEKPTTADHESHFEDEHKSHSMVSSLQMRSRNFLVVTIFLLTGVILRY